jgi:hypothetical protein
LLLSPTDYGDADVDDGNYTDAEGGGDNGSEVDEKEDHEERTNEVDDRDDGEHHRTTRPALTCGPDRGGCDHECRVVNDPEARIECSCYSGFLLEQADQRSCHGE